MATGEPWQPGPGSSGPGGRTRRRVLWGVAGAAAVVALVAGGLAVVRSGSGDGAAGPVTTTTPVTGADAIIEIAAIDPATLAETAAFGLVPLGRIAVVLADDRGPADAAAVATAVGGEVVGRLGALNLYQIAFAPTDEAGLQAALRAAKAQPGVDLAFPEQSAVVTEEVWGVRQSPLDDTVYGGALGDGYRDIGVQQAWDYLRGAGVTTNPVQVGVVDSGLWTGNGEFDGDVEVTFPDPAAGERATPEKTAAGTDKPTGGHGTSVANIIGADPRNGGVAGVAGVLGDKLTISAVNTFTPPYGIEYQEIPGAPPPADPTQYSAHGRTYASGSLAAIQRAVNSGARVVNLSIGCHDCWPETRDAYHRYLTKMAADHPEVLFVAAAGNYASSEDGSRYWPGGLQLPNLITVGNVNNDGTNNSSTNTANAGFEVTLAAPGHEAVQGVGPDGTVIHSYGGTSMATPQVSATAALLLSIKPDLTAAQLKDLLASSARTSLKIGDTERAIDPGVGGRLLATDRAVLAVLRLVKPEWAAMNDDELGTLLTEQGVIDAVAVSGATPGEWTVRGIVKSCRAGCTDVSITVSGSDFALGGDSTIHLSAPGEVSWSLTLTEPSATIVVRRLDNDAASIITITAVDLNGTWTGTATIANISVPEGAEMPEGCDLNELIGKTFGLRLDVTAAEGGGGQAVLVLTPPADLSDEPAEPQTVPITWTGNSITISFSEDTGTATFTGTASRSAGGIETLTGTWSLSDQGITVSGPWTATKQA